VLPHFEYFFEQFLVGIGSWLLMKAFSTLLISALLVAGCSQVIDQFYSKKNFNAQTFNADISECKEQNSSLAAMHVDAVEPKNQVDDAMVRECMKAKGYVVQLETK
jgi:PBP1b-binding outer membrane lipoprotein LpoB